MGLGRSTFIELLENVMLLVDLFIDWSLCQHNIYLKFRLSLANDHFGEECVLSVVSDMELFYIQYMEGQQVCNNLSP